MDNHELTMMNGGIFERGEGPGAEVWRVINVSPARWFWPWNRVLAVPSDEHSNWNAKRWFPAEEVSQWERWEIPAALVGGETLWHGGKLYRVVEVRGEPPCIRVALVNSAGPFFSVEHKGIEADFGRELLRRGYRLARPEERERAGLR